MEITGNIADKSCITIQAAPQVTMPMPLNAVETISVIFTPFDNLSFELSDHVITCDRIFIWVES